MDFDHIIYESDYDDFELYVVDSFKEKARAYVYDKEDDVWQTGCVTEVKEIFNNDPDNYISKMTGNYTGEFIGNDFDFYVGINVVGNASPTDVLIIKALKSMKLHIC